MWSTLTKNSGNFRETVCTSSVVFTVARYVEAWAAQFPSISEKEIIKFNNYLFRGIWPEETCFSYVCLRVPIGVARGAKGVMPPPNF